MENSNTPADGAAQLDIEAASRHTPSVLRSSDVGNADSERAGETSPHHPHVFHLAKSSPSVYDGGTLQGATQDNWKILDGQQGSVYIARLQPGGIREPHWHPSAWELNYVISGRVRWSFVGPRAVHDMFEAEAGDLIFAPQGHFHYFENASDTEELVVLIVFNTSAAEPDDDVGIVASLSAIPPDVLAAAFKTSVEAFQNLPKSLERVTIARKPR